MEGWLEWARGPAFRFAFLLMVLGLIRVFILNLVNMWNVLHHARAKSIPVKTVFRETLRWLFPMRIIFRNRLYFAAVSFLFHLAVIVTPLFLCAHIRLWERTLGIRWPSLNQTLLDYLTLLAVATAAILFIQRIHARATRTLSRLQDYILPLIIAVPFISGYLAMHPAMNPFSYEATLFVHVMSGNLVFVLVPFSKLSHVVLFPTMQLVSELGWHFDPEAGGRVAVALGKENEPI